MIAVRARLPLSSSANNSSMVQVLGMESVPYENALAEVHRTIIRAHVAAVIDKLRAINIGHFQLITAVELNLSRVVAGNECDEIEKAWPHNTIHVCTKGGVGGVTKGFQMTNQMKHQIVNGLQMTMTERRLEFWTGMVSLRGDAPTLRAELADQCDRMRAIVLKPKDEYFGETKYRLSGKLSDKQDDLLTALGIAHRVLFLSKLVQVQNGGLVLDMGSKQ